LGYIFAVPFAMASASPKLGLVLMRLKLCAIPEEIHQPAILQALDTELSSKS
jgi:membrane glycosyltransferase